MTADAIVVHDLTKRFDGTTVVNGINLSVPRGQIMGFLGPNGSGKTTTIRMLCGLLEPDGGTGQVLSHDIHHDRRAIKRKVGYTTQRFSFYEDLTIAENLQFVAGLYNLPDARQTVRRTIDDLGLASRKSQLAGELSGGWKQRLALAACIMHRPELLLLDEPTAGVDPKARREFWDEIHALTEAGLTVLVSTHYMDEAERCHRIAYISNGTQIAKGTVQEVKRDAGLTTMILTGDGCGAAARALAGADGVAQVAHFGAALHVVGTDAHALHRTVMRIAQETGCKAAPAETSLEDVFIQFMNGTRDRAP